MLKGAAGRSHTLALFRPLPPSSALSVAFALFSAKQNPHDLNVFTFDAFGHTNLGFKGLKLDGIVLGSLQEPRHFSPPSRLLFPLLGPLLLLILQGNSPMKMMFPPDRFCRPHFGCTATRCVVLRRPTMLSPTTFLPSVCSRDTVSFHITP